MKKVLISLSVIAAVAAIGIGATVAYFSDVETSTGNTFTAGAIDLKVDSTQHYNGHECVVNTNSETSEDMPYVWGPGNNPYPETETACGGTWGQRDGKDIVDEKFFNFADIKPGDEGENTISLHVINNDAWVCAEVSGLTDNENGQNEPEALAEANSDPNGTTGELSQTMNWVVWRDDGTGAGGVAGDNIQNGSEETLAQGHPVNGVLPIYDSTTNTGALAGGTTAYLGVKWELPAGSGNETQTDILTGDISFRVEQSRNNAGFRCDGQTDEIPR